MSVVTFQVTPRMVLVPDGDGKYLITPAKLNDMANPIVTGSIDETAFLPSLQLTVGDVVSSSRVVSIQALMGGANYAQRMRINTWLTEDSDVCGVSGNAPSGGYGNSNQQTLITDANGLVQVTIQNTVTQTTWYLCAEINGRVYVSGAISLPV